MRSFILFSLVAAAVVAKVVTSRPVLTLGIEDDPVSIDEEEEGTRPKRVTLHIYDIDDEGYVQRMDQVYKSLENKTHELSEVFSVEDIKRFIEEWKEKRDEICQEDKYVC